MEFLQQNVLLLAVTLISGSMLVMSFVRGGIARGVSPHEATLLINREDALMLDVREDSEWAEGRAPNSRHIPLRQLTNRMGELEKFKDKPIVVLCRSGNRSTSACALLRKAGFDKVHSLSGGIGAWQDAGLPVVRK